MNLGASFVDDVMPAYSFSVIMNGGRTMQFNKISNMGSDLDYETYCEGGLNTYPHILANPASTASKVSLTRFVKSNVNECGIYVGMRMKEPLYVSITNVNQNIGGEIKTKNVSVGAGVAKGFSFLFTGCLVTSHHFSDLDAQHSALMEETIEVVYEKMYYMPGLNATGSINF